MGDDDLNSAGPLMTMAVLDDSSQCSTEVEGQKREGKKGERRLFVQFSFFFFLTHPHRLPPPTRFYAVLTAPLGYCLFLHPFSFHHHHPHLPPSSYVAKTLRQVSRDRYFTGVSYEFYDETRISMPAIVSSLNF